MWNAGGETPLGLCRKSGSTIKSKIIIVFDRDALPALLPYGLTQSARLTLQRASTRSEDTFRRDIDWRFPSRSASKLRVVNCTKRVSDPLTTR